jgi:hypothetical protein
MSANRHTALLLVRTLSAQGGTNSKPEVAELRTGKLRAFFQGLTFRIPSFQLSAQSVWSSLGLGIGFLIVATVLFSALAFATLYADTTLHWAGSRSAYILPLLFGTSLLLLFGLRQFHGWVAQRLFLAATIATIVNVAFAFYIFGAVTIFSIYDGRATQVIVGLTGASLILAYSIWKMWRAR